MEPNHDPVEDKLVDLVEECLTAFSTTGVEAVQNILDAHPEHADELRRRVQALAQIGFIEGLDQTPEHFGPYSIKRRLGRGGMSAVYLAYDARMKRDVALKCAHAGLALDERAQVRFQREVEAAAKLIHPAIVPVFDAGQADGRAYFTMEYAEGATLANLIKQLHHNEAAKPRKLRSNVIIEAVGASDPCADLWQRSYIEMCCRWTLEIAGALAHAHAAGVVHRDVNPANIIVRQSGHAQLFDFGLAMLRDAPSLTVFGEFTGTPYYVSPEQLTGKVGDMDERCDIYSAGVTLYELLTLKRPFEGTSTLEVLNRIQSHDPVSPRVHEPKIPRDLELICLTALERDRKRRYETMAAFAADLRAFLNFEPVSARPLSSTERAVRFVRLRPALTSTLLLGAAVLIGLPILLTVKNRAIVRERDAAVAAADRSKRITDEFEEFIMGLFEPERMGSQNINVEDLVARGVERLARIDPSEDEQIELALLETTGYIFGRMGLFDRSQMQFGLAASIRHEQKGENPSRFAETSRMWATSLTNMGDPKQAHSVLENAFRALEHAGEHPILRISLHLGLAEADMRLGSAEAALPHLERALAIPIPVNVVTPAEFNRINLQIGDLANNLGHTKLAKERFEAALSAQRTRWRVSPTAEIAIRKALAIIAHDSGQTEVETRHSRRIQDTEQRAMTWSRMSDQDRPHIPIGVEATDALKQASQRFDAALFLLVTDKLDEARDAFTACLELDPGNPLIALNLRDTEFLAGNPDAAYDWLQKAIDFGYGRSPAQVQPFSTDPTFESLRSHPRFQSLVTQLEIIENEPVPMRVVSAPNPTPTTPLLVFLNATDTSFESADFQHIQAAARALDWNLIAIKPDNPTGPGSIKWMESKGGFDIQVRKASEVIIKRIRSQITEPRPAANMLPQPLVMLAAAGDSGPIAAHLAFEHAGLFRGLIMLDTFPGNETPNEAMQDAAISGLAVSVVNNPATPIKWLKPDATKSNFASSVAAHFEALAFDTRTYQTSGGEDLQRVFAAALDRVRELNE